VDLSIQTPVQDVDYGRLRDLWQVADAGGVATAYTFDHLAALAPGARPGAPGDRVVGSQFDGWMVAQALAMQTSRMRVGTLVTSITHRPVSVLAKMVTTLHAITGGRAILGVGCGWHADEHNRFGLDFAEVGDRMGLLDEALEVIGRWWRSPDPVTFAGRHLAVHDARLDPRPDPTRPLPILVGGSGSRLRQIAARHADVYNGFWSPELWPEVNRGLDDELRHRGREPAALRRSAFVPAELSRLPSRQDSFVEEQMRCRGGDRLAVRSRCVFADGSAPDVLARFEVAGVDEVVLHLDPTTDPDDLGRFLDDHAP